MRTRKDVLKEFGTDELVSLLPFPVSESVGRMADRIAELEASTEARVVTDAMVERASLALWARYGDHIAATVGDDDIRVMLTAALTQGDA